MNRTSVLKSEIYLKGALSEVSHMARGAKTYALKGNTAEALRLVEDIECKLIFIKKALQTPQ